MRLGTRFGGIAILLFMVFFLISRKEVSNGIFLLEFVRKFTLMVIPTVEKDQSVFPF